MRTVFRKHPDKWFHIDINPDKLAREFSYGRGFVCLAYCQKPLKCPVGRFSTKCMPDSGPACKGCFFGQVKKLCQRLGINFYIVLTDTDAIGVILAREIERAKSTTERVPYILTLCNMVLHTTKYIAPLFGLRGVIFPFRKGHCTTLAAYELAEYGIKNCQTDISDYCKQIAIEILEKAYRLKISRESNAPKILFPKDRTS